MVVADNQVTLFKFSVYREAVLAVHIYFCVYEHFASACETDERRMNQTIYKRRLAHEQLCGNIKQIQTIQ